MDTSKLPWVAYNVIERPGGKKIWHKVGAAWLNKDGSWNIVLDSLPVDGRLNIREKREWDDKPAHGGALAAEAERIEA